MPSRTTKTKEQVVQELSTSDGVVRRLAELAAKCALPGKVVLPKLAEERKILGSLLEYYRRTDLEDELAAVKKQLQELNEGKKQKEERDPFVGFGV